MGATDPRIKSTHIAVWYTAAIHYTFLHHGVSALCGLFFVYPVRLEPMLARNQPKFDLRGSEHRDAPCTTLIRISLSEEALRTNSLNSSVNGSSFKKTYGYRYFRLNLASISIILLIAPLRSEFRHRMKNVAFARWWTMSSPS
jgi:hypothetical protein